MPTFYRPRVVTVTGGGRIPWGLVLIVGLFLSAAPVLVAAAADVAGVLDALGPYVLALAACMGLGASALAGWVAHECWAIGHQDRAWTRANKADMAARWAVSRAARGPQGTDRGLPSPAPRRALGAASAGPLALESGRRPASSTVTRLGHQADRKRSQ